MDSHVYDRTRAEDLLHRSLPLMHIYRKEKEESFHKQLRRLREKTGKYRIISTAPPLYTMSETLLKRILQHNMVSEPEYNKIISYHANDTQWRKRVQHDRTCKISMTHLQKTLRF